MTRDEFFDQVARLVNAAWPHSQLPNPSLALMFDDLRDLPVEQVVVAVRVLAREGREFAPTGGQIRAKVVDLSVDAPAWPEVRRTLLRAYGYSERRYVAGVGVVNEREKRLEREPELVRRFADLVGWDEIAVLLDVNDRTAEAQIRNKWEAMVAGDKGDMTLLGLPTAGLARLERVNEPRQLDAAKILHLPLPREEAS